MRKLEEKELARLCAKKDPASQTELYLKYAGKLFALCLRYSTDRNDAEDLLQESFIRALDKIGSFKYRGEGSLYAWLSRIAVNLAINRISRSKFRYDSLDSMALEPVEEQSADDVGTIPKEKMLEMIANLPPTKKAVFNLYCIEGYSHREIADMLGITEKGSAGLLAKARMILKKEINDCLKNS